MTIHERLAEHDHEELRAIHDPDAGLRGFVAIHDTTLGPAAGGTRRYAFESEDAAIEDVLRLSRAMTYKYALAGIDMGGAKSVIRVDDEDDYSEALYRAHGRAVDEYGGRFVTGADVGTGTEALRWINAETEYVIGLPEQFDHPDGYHPGARGVLRAMAACCAIEGLGDVGDQHVAVQGVGEMGGAIVRGLRERGARVTVCDVDDERVETVRDEFEVTAVDPDAIFDVDCDVFCPAALGGVLNDDTIPRLSCAVVCGAANNQLADEARHGRALREAGILYAPDYLANAGRTIDDTDLLRPGGYTHERARRMIDAIYDRMLAVEERAASEERPTAIAANRIAEERIASLGSIRSRVEPRTPRW